jgi:hypothetical protein
MAHNNSNFIPNSILVRNLSNGWDLVSAERLAGLSVHSVCNIGRVPCVLVVSTATVKTICLVVHCGSNKSQLYVEIT